MVKISARIGDMVFDRGIEAGCGVQGTLMYLCI